MTLYKITVVDTVTYELEVEADSRGEALDVFTDIEKNGDIEEEATEKYSLLPLEVVSIEEIV